MKKWITLMLILSLVTLTACDLDKKVPDPASKEKEAIQQETLEEPEAPPAESEKEIKAAPVSLEEKPEPEKTAQSKDKSALLEKQSVPFWQKGLSEESLNVSGQITCADPYSYFYLMDNSRKLCWDASQMFSENAEKSSADLLIGYAEETDYIGERIKEDYFAEIVNLNDEKYQLEFYENGVKVKESNRGEGFVNEALLKVEEDAYQKILDNLDQKINLAQEHGSVQWLSSMKRSRITEMTFTTADGTQSKTYGGFDNYVYEDVNQMVKNCRVTEKRQLENAASVVINFNNSLQLKVYLDEKELLIYASDIDTALLYELQFPGGTNIYEKYAKGHLNPRTGKPVIYLYPEEPTQCHVEVGYPQFTYTYPAYEDGWNVTAYPDGKLINQKDNSEHYYLFWEGNEKIQWNYSEGFVIKGEDTESFLREKLSFMGLNPREYNDFITYWVPQMKENPYNLITFAGEQYEKLAPLTITPKPDSLLRIHMVYKPLTEPVEIQEQKLVPFERKGFAAVEWGGTRDD